MRVMGYYGSYRLLVTLNKFTVQVTKRGARISASVLDMAWSFCCNSLILTPRWHRSVLGFRAPEKLRPKEIHLGNPCIKSWRANTLNIWAEVIAKALHIPASSKSQNALLSFSKRFPG